MKKLTFITSLTFTFLMLFITNTNAQKFNGLDVSPMDAATYPSDHKKSGKFIKVVYGRPQLKGRPLSTLAPNDKIWRTGANEATEITFYKDVKLGETTVKAGTYSLTTIPGEKEWTIILNSDLNVWGAYFYKEENDVARLKVAVSKGEESLEAFSIAFQETDKGVNMFLGWDTVRISVPINN